MAEPFKIHFMEKKTKPEQSKVVTPSSEEQHIFPDEGYAISDVLVEAIPYPEPEGTIDISENGLVDVAAYENANVNVPQGVFPEGSIKLTTQGEHDVTAYATAEVDTLPEKGLIFEDYDSDGYPHSARFVGTWTEIPTYYFSNLGNKNNSFCAKITHINIPNDVSTIGLGAFEGAAKIETINLPNNDLVVNPNAFRSMSQLSKITFNRNVTFNSSTGTHMYVFADDDHLREVIFKGNVNLLPEGVFAYCRRVELYDFSHCISIPPLWNTAAFVHASGCVIKIPAALSDTTLGEGNGWESATNWAALTDIIWEVNNNA